MYPRVHEGGHKHVGETWEGGRLFPPPVFDHLQYASTEGDLVICSDSGSAWRTVSSHAFLVLHEESNRVKYVQNIEVQCVLFAQ